MNDAHTVLVRARNTLDREGWTKGCKGMTTTAPFCAMGAIGHVMKVRVFPGTGYSYGESGASSAARALVAAIGNPEITPGSLYCWNDGSTRKQVFAAFDKAINATSPPPAVPDLEVVEEEAACLV